jgi:two-component system, cell cycle response regulator
MNPDAMATRLSVLTRALPMRVLLVDDDELELELLSDRLRSAGFQTVCAQDGEQALAQLASQWYPLVITDWQMPVMDGIAFTEALRARGLDDTYVIMLTMRGANLDYERGYLAGVDDYLTKKVPDAELFARIHGAFNTLALRRSLKETRSALEESVSIDADSGAFAPRELTSKLNSEIRRAQRYGRNVSIVVLNAVEPGGATPPAETLRTVVQVLDASIRAHIDFVGRIEAPAGASFAVVLPEAGVGDAPAIKERILSALTQYTLTSGVELLFSVGVSAIDRSATDGVQIDANEMLQVAVHCLNCPGRTGQEQLRAVQSSVACHASIVCRHGYAVDDECSMKAAGAQRTLAAVG